MNQETIDLVREYYPEWTPKSSERGSRLPHDEQAEFVFSIYELPDGERQISARRVSGTESEYFWYTAYEVGSFPGGSNGLIKAFHNDLRNLLGHDTRIRQTNGLVFADFRCEYVVDGNWSIIRGASALRWSNFQIPDAPLYKSVYYRGPRGRAPHLL